MAKQIAISDDVYQLLVGMKNDNKSFSEVIRALAFKKRNTLDIMKYAGILKKDGRRLKRIKRLIAQDREKSYGRVF